MKYGDVQRAVAANTRTSTRVVKEVLDEFFNIVKSHTLAGGGVTVPRFGRFSGRHIDAVYNRRIGDRVVDIPAQTKLAFRPSKKASVKH